VAEAPKQGLWARMRERRADRRERRTWRRERLKGTPNVEGASIRGQQNMHGQALGGGMGGGDGGAAGGVGGGGS
jgi:hypothetical protein